MYFEQEDRRKAPKFIKDKEIEFDGVESSMVLHGDKVIEWHDVRRSNLFMTYRRLINSVWWPL